jgi:ABC-2 type transport system ATP-binding protein
VSIEISNLCKSYTRKGKEIKALDNISLNIKEGEFVGLLGPNGAGKTTLSKILSTLLLPTSGEAYINGISIFEDKKIRNIVGSVFGETGGRSLYYRLSVKDNLLFYGTLYGIRKTEIKKRINSLLKYFDLAERKDTLVMKLSTGMKAKVLLIRALITFPKILLLDEPTLGFDAESSEKAKDLLLEFNREFGTSVLLTSHNFSEMDALTSRLILIDDGHLIQDCSPDLFKKSAGHQYVHIIFSLPPLPSESLHISKMPTEIFAKMISDSAGAEIISLEQQDNHNFIYEAKIKPISYTFNETISRITVLILRAKGEIFQIVPHMPSLKESFLSFLEINKQKEKTQAITIEEIFTIPLREEE